MNRRTVLRSCLGFLGALVGMPLVGNVGEIVGVDPGQGKSKAGYYRRIIKVKSLPVNRLEYFRMVRSLDRYKRQSARDFKILLRRA